MAPVIKALPILSFAIGDLVRLIRNKPGSIRLREVGTEGLICAAALTDGRLEYGFEGSYWWPHSCFELVRRATPEDMRAVLKMMSDEEGDDDDEDDGEDVYNAEDDDDDDSLVSAAIEWFTNLDFGLAATEAAENAITVNSTSGASLYEIFNEGTTFGIQVPPPNHPGPVYVVEVQGRDLRLTFTFVTAHSCVVAFHDVDGGDVDKLESYMLDEFDAYQL